MQRQKGSEQTDPINLQETLGENSTNLLNCRFFQSGLSRWILVILAHRQLRGAIAWEMHDAVTPLMYADAQSVLEESGMIDTGVQPPPQ